MNRDCFEIVAKPTTVTDFQQRMIFMAFYQCGSNDDDHKKAKGGCDESGYQIKENKANYLPKQANPSAFI